MRRFLMLGWVCLLGAVASADDLFPFFPMGDHLDSVWKSGDRDKVAGEDGPVRVAGKDFVTDAGVKKFWAVNTCFSMNFCNKDEAEKYAARMARFGINAVRLHHMDSRDIWTPGKPKLEIDPVQLDKLDWYIFQLKRHGIYVNINLHVSRLLGTQEGMPTDDSPKQNKGVDNFYPAMVTLQKKYAKDLLSHVNPYTKMSYLEDPCVAMIEINNENSLVSQWFGWGFENLAEPYEKELQRQWNAWLVKKYGTTANLRKAWDCKTFPLEANLVDDAASQWHLENGSGKGTLEEKDGALKLTVEKIGKVAWNPQFYLRNFSIKGGVPYTLSFRAKANVDRKLSVGVSENHADWRTLGFHARFDVTKEWQTFTYTFIAERDDDQCRFSFSSFEPGTFEFDSLSLRAGGSLGIADDEKLEDGSVRILYRGRELFRNLKQAYRDFVNFILDVENNYWQDMYRYVKDELKAKAPVSGTQLNYGLHHAQARLDYCDIHSYWNHPNFPGRPWDGNNWKVKNRPLVNVLGASGNIPNLANHRILGLPYTVSEYNHPYPNLYGAEGFPMIASIGAFQDWSGIFIFAWSHTREFTPGGIPSFFDIAGNPMELVHMPACYNMFVRGDVTSALAAKDAKKVVYSVTEAEEREMRCEVGRMNLGFTAENPLRSYAGVRMPDLNLSADPTAGTQAFVKPENYVPPTKTVSHTGQLVWNAETEKQGFYQVDTPKTKVFTGFVNGRTFTYQDGTKLEIGPTKLNWATLTMTQVGQGRYLVAATGLMKSTGMKLRPYDQDEIEGKKEIVDTEDYASLIDKDVTYCRARGGAPMLCEGIPAVVTFPAPAGKTVTLYPLDGNASRMAGVAAERVSGDFVKFTLSPKYQTLWYEVEIK
ncbi:MAG: carbohydrate binding domain-containing protein [Planctomycetia bacterium]|nr:carbohydrate binding domain-containing protein [Planctomycetia bacterium]